MKKNKSNFKREDSSKFTKLYSSKKDPHKILVKVLGRKFLEYRDGWEKTANFKLKTPYPLQLDFELNYSCNLRCKMCSWAREILKTSKKDWFPYKKFKEIVAEGVKLGLVSINFNFLNEPLIRKDIVKFIRYAKQKGVLDLMLNTNGMLLDKKIAKELINSGLTRIMISIDAATKKTYEKIRIGGDFNKVVQNTLNFINLRNQSKKKIPLVRVSFLKTLINEHELNDFLKFWKDRVDFFAIQQYLNPFPEDRKTEKLKTKKRVTLKNFRCPMSWQRLVIRYNGNVLPCCTFYGVKLIMGNVYQQKISQIWNSKKMKNFQAIHKKGKFFENKICQKCAANLRVNA